VTYAPVQLDRDEAIWLAYVAGTPVDQLAQRYNLHRSSVYKALHTYRASIPEDERELRRDRALQRLEELYVAHRERAKTSTRSATVCRQVTMDQCRLAGLIRGQVEHYGHVEHEHAWTPGPTVEELLERYRAQGLIGAVPRVELTRTDQEAQP
jgi:hypothetical protein